MPMVYKFKEYDFNKNIKKIIALNMRKFRKEKGYTQEELALYTDRSFEFIRRIESEEGKRGFSVETLWRVALVLEKPIDDFFDDVWSQTDADKCKIYDYSDYAAIPAQDAKELQVGLDSAVDKG